MPQRTMLAISAREWDGIESRPHHLMRRFARAGWNVVFLEPPASVTAPLKSPSRFARWTRWRRGPRPAEHGVTLLAPPPILPFSCERRAINGVNQRLIARSLLSAVPDLASRAVDVYSFLPSSIDLLPRLRYERLIYDCVDDHAAFSGWVDAETVRQMERELFERSDLCLATAASLLKRAQRWNANAHLIPNGCEYEHFEPAARDATLPTPADLRELIGPDDSTGRRRLVGFIGGLGDWIDVDLIAAVARRQPQLRFVFIGPGMIDVGTLSRIDNVHLVGPKPYSDLPAFLRHFAVCLIPFRVNQLTRSVNPIKLFEYLAAGKPVVSTPLPEVLPYRQVVAIAEGAEAFVAAIEQAVAASARNDEAISMRQRIAAENSWTSRWERIAELMSSIEACR